MASFEYTALTAAGERIAGVLAGANEQAILSELESRKLTPVHIAEQAQRRRSLRGVSSRQLGLSYVQLGDLLRAGVPVLRALNLLGRRKSQPALSEVFRHLAERVAEGGGVADAMAERPEVFSPIHVAMVRAGEQGGFLEQVTSRLGRLVMAQAEMRSKVIGSLIYPMVLVSVGSVILTVIFTLFVPMFRATLEKQVTELPLVTNIVFGISDALTRHGLVLLTVVSIAAFTVWRLSKKPGFRLTVAKWRTLAPVIGPLTRALATARFCRMLGTMEANGVPLLTAMGIAKAAAGNALMEAAIEETAESVRAGESLAEPLGRSGLFPDDVIEMISVGEQAGNIDEVLLGIADTVEERIDRMLSTLIKLLEPLVLVIIAMGVAIVAVALILPMTQLTTSV